MDTSVDSNEAKPAYDLAKFIENPIDFLNEHFVDEYSLAGIEALIAEVNAEMRKQDRRLMELIKEKAISGEMAHERFEKLQCATNDLIAQLAEIRIPTMRGEQSLKILTADIRALNRAKHNICNTITNLKRILMLSTMLESLREKAKNRKYNEAAGLAVVVRELYQLVTPLREAPPVVRLLTSCNNVINNLKQQITEDLEIMLALNTTHSISAPLELDEVCRCADGIDESIRKHIASKYAAHITQSYEAMFSISVDLKNIDNLNERFAWLRRAITDFDELYGAGVPEHWHIQATGAWAFFEACRNQVVATLTSAKDPFDASLILTSLLRCKEFEQELDYRLSNYGDTPEPIERHAVEYPEAVPEPAPAPTAAAVEQRKSLKGVLSRCFENYLGPWVAKEESQLEVLYNKIVSLTDDTVIMHVLRSAKELFSAINVRLKAVLAVSNEQTLFEMSMVFRRVIAKYQAHLQERLAKIEKHAPLAAVAKKGGLIIATCDYAIEMVEHLNDEIVDTIAPAYKEQVNCGPEKGAQPRRGQPCRAEKINVTKAAAVKRLIDESCKFAPITPNVAAPFKNLEQRILEVIKLTIEHLPAGYLHYVTNKVTRGAMLHVKTTVFSLASATEGYCQQLLLDSYSLQKLLLESVKVMVDPLPLGYLEATSAEMDKLQTLLKVLNSPSSPLEAFDGGLARHCGRMLRSDAGGERRQLHPGGDRPGPGDPPQKVDHINATAIATTIRGSVVLEPQQLGQALPGLGALAVLLVLLREAAAEVGVEAAAQLPQLRLHVLRVDGDGLQQPDQVQQLAVVLVAVELAHQDGVLLLQRARPAVVVQHDHAAQVAAQLAQVLDVGALELGAPVAVEAADHGEAPAVGDVGRHGVGVVGPEDDLVVVDELAEETVRVGALLDLPAGAAVVLELGHHLVQVDHESGQVRRVVELADVRQQGTLLLREHGGRDFHHVVPATLQHRRHLHVALALLAEMGEQVADQHQRGAAEDSQRHNRHGVRLLVGVISFGVALVLFVFAVSCSCMVTAGCRSVAACHLIVVHCAFRYSRATSTLFSCDRLPAPRAVILGGRKTAVP
ncbi:vacuolar protein sorting-associated protein 53 A [Babesia caballi]|uniref:Vacuolar protein sorting-associated protein 53 A n=1 Tax=Babesia caballi TaxID=5871 RepID=A0AAV4LZA8_BABCB|nr:vacuolar protein sorting-associated protein 53 A [Babesia caballi]